MQYKNVTELNHAIKQLLEEPFVNITVCGELSNCKISNNNLFATLKDANSAINIVSWAYNQKKNKINVENGDIVSAFGRITVYGKTGSYCLMILKLEKISPENTGSVHQEYEELKKKYNGLGYFDNKKKFPSQINKIGIVTALQGAALQDILYVLKHNNFTGKVIVKGCLVQGIQATESISQAITFLDTMDLDLIIITRGGGSLEDLIAFSSVEVIEAIHKCSKFTISAVGHEIDFMLSDFVADLRAPTPSVSAEIVSTYQKSQLDEYKKYNSFVCNHMKQIIIGRLESYRSKIALLLMSEKISNPLGSAEEQLNKFKNHFLNSIKSRILTTRNFLERAGSELDKFDINGTLERGFAIVTKNKKIIDSVNDAAVGQKLKLKMKDGEISVTVIDNK